MKVGSSAFLFDLDRIPFAVVHEFADFDWVNTRENWMRDWCENREGESTGIGTRGVSGLLYCAFFRLFRCARVSVSCEAFRRRQ